MIRTIRRLKITWELQEQITIIFLNGLREEKIYLGDQWIRFSADKYINSQGDSRHFVAATLLGFVGEMLTLYLTMIDNFANKNSTKNNICLTITDNTFVLFWCTRTLILNLSLE